jgi:ABC-type transporter Mla maintaining outer membrane lipid asymmetry ATPase subunit MlaF
VFTLRNLDVRRGGKLILSDLLLDVPRAAVTGLLGPSGSWKTTLLQEIVVVQIVKREESERLALAAYTDAASALAV